MPQKELIIYREYTWNIIGILDVEFDFKGIV
jgi:hypothetical protein